MLTGAGANMWVSNRRQRTIRSEHPHRVPAVVGIVHDENNQRLWYHCSHARIERNHCSIEPLFAPYDEERYAQGFRDLGAIKWHTHGACGERKRVYVGWECVFGHESLTY
jgi:hypothetical protein